MAINNNISNKERIVLVDGINDAQALSLTNEYPFAVFFTNNETTSGHETLRNNIYKDGKRYTKFQNVDRNGIYIDKHKICLGYDETTGIVKLYDAYTLENIKLTYIGVNAHNELNESFFEENPENQCLKDENGSYIIISDDNIYTLRFKLDYIEENTDGQRFPSTSYVDLSLDSELALPETLIIGDVQIGDYVKNIPNSSLAEQFPEATETVPTSNPYFHTSRKVYQAIKGTQYNYGGGDFQSYVRINERGQYDLRISSGDVHCNQFIVGKELSVSYKSGNTNIPVGNEYSVDLTNSTQYETVLSCSINPSNSFDQTIEWTITGPAPLPSIRPNDTNSQSISLSGSGEGTYTVTAKLQNNISVKLNNGDIHTYSKPIEKTFNIVVVDRTPYYWYISDIALPSTISQSSIVSNASEKGFHKLDKSVLNEEEGYEIVNLKHDPIEFGSAKKYYIAVPQLQNSKEIVPGHDLVHAGAEFGNDEWEFSKTTKTYGNVTYNVYTSYNIESRYTGKLFIKKN